MAASESAGDNTQYPIQVSWEIFLTWLPSVAKHLNIDFKGDKKTLELSPVYPNYKPIGKGTFNTEAPNKPGTLSYDFRPDHLAT